MTEDTAASEHDYRACPDTDCADEQCLAFRAGLSTGYDTGFRRGAAAGYKRGRAAARRAGDGAPP